MRFVAEDAYRDKVLRTFFKRGRLTGIPASPALH
jgi:hypothetical protein